MVGRVAVVTGANKGIGYWIAYHLGQPPSLFDHIVLACRDEGRGQEAVDQLTESVTKAGGASFSTEAFSLGDSESHAKFVEKMETTYGKVDVLVNNAAFAYKSDDPTPHKDQCKPTLDVNFRGTVDFTEKMIPLLKKGTDPRIVNVASGLGRLGQISPELQPKFTSNSLTIPELLELVNEYERDVLDGSHSKKGWGNSNYGMSKLALIAATRVWARELQGIAVVNSCCPGYCATDMTTHKGHRDPKDGAKNAVLPATMENPPTGSFFSDYKEAMW